MDDIKKDFLDTFLAKNQTVWESSRFKELERREYATGFEAVLEDLLTQPELENAEMLWLLKKLTYFYGRPDELLQKAPPQRLMLNMGAVLRVLYVLLDAQNPDLEPNLRRYMSAKLSQAAWGIEPHTRKYLEKM